MDDKKGGKSRVASQGLYMWAQSAKSVNLSVNLATFLVKDGQDTFFSRERLPLKKVVKTFVLCFGGQILNKETWVDE